MAGWVCRFFSAVNPVSPLGWPVERKQDCGITRSEISQESYLLSPAGDDRTAEEQSPTNSPTLITGIRTIRFSALLSRQKWEIAWLGSATVPSIAFPGKRTVDASSGSSRHCFAWFLGKKNPKGQMHFFIFTEQPMSLPVSLGFYLNVSKRDIFDETALNSLKIRFSSDLER